LIKKADAASNWGYIATWGKQSLNNDNLGIAVLFRTKDVKEITEDKLNHVVVFNSADKDYIDYYFLGAWELEPDGITTKQQFIQYLDKLVADMNKPVVLK